MSRELFGTDGVRGLAGEYPLDEAGAARIGLAVGSHFAQPGQTIVLGYDPRESSAGLAANVTAGLLQAGVNVVSAGVLPTPGLAYLTREGDYVAGVMITASHNPVEYNGVKVFDRNGDKLSDATETQLNELITNGAESRGGGKASEDTDLVRLYEDFLVGSVAQLSGLKLAVDSANGAASDLAARVLYRLDAAVTAVFDQPNGQNINDGCGATHPEAVTKVVLENKLDVGIALDGDADRVVLVDNQGREVRGDYIMYILAVSAKLKGVVATEMSNQGFVQSLKDRGIDVKRTKVGDRYVLEGLQQTGYKLGGEQSGHIILPELLATGDGLFAAIKTLAAVSASGKSLAQWCDEVKLLPQALVNIPLQDKSLLDKPAVQAYLAEQTSQLGASGRIVVRPSGTEPLARVMVEADNAEDLANLIAVKLQELLHG